MTTGEIRGSVWFPFSDEPLLEGTVYTPRFSNPYVILPSGACDGKWHLFVHSWIGIHHFVSDSGIAWKHDKILEYGGRFPSVYYEDELYYLVYEKNNYRNPVSSVSKEHRAEVLSRIEIRTSEDLITWSRPKTVLESKDVPFASDYVKNPMLSIPQIVKKDETYMLYFGASETLLDDVNQKVVRYLGCAFGRKADGPFSLGKPEKPVLEADPNDPDSNLACGSVRIVQASDKIYAFQCSSYWDENKRKSSSVLRILESEDGIEFVKCGKKPVLVPADTGWTSGSITGCDVHYKADEQCWYCFYSAKEKKNSAFQKESIGLMIGSVPTKFNVNLKRGLSEVLFV